jgi:hypothetical protein
MIRTVPYYLLITLSLLNSTILIFNNFFFNILSMPFTSSLTIFSLELIMPTFFFSLNIKRIKPCNSSLLHNNSILNLNFSLLSIGINKSYNKSLKSINLILSNPKAKIIDNNMISSLKSIKILIMINYYTLFQSKLNSIKKIGYF